MFEIISKAFQIGVGLVATTGKKVEELAKELAEKGKLSQTEAQKLADDMVAKSAETKKNLKAQIERRIEEVIHRMHLPTKDDIDSLKARIAKLEKTGKEK